MDLDGKNRREDSLLGHMAGNQQKNAAIKYFIIGFVRVMGIAIMAAGFAVILNGFMQLPEILGYFLAFMGAFEFIAMPIILAKIWKTPENEKSDAKNIRKNNDKDAGIEKQ